MASHCHQDLGKRQSRRVAGTSEFSVSDVINKNISFYKHAAAQWSESEMAALRAFSTYQKESCCTQTAGHVLRTH